MSDKVSGQERNESLDGRVQIADKTNQISARPTFDPNQRNMSDQTNSAEPDMELEANEMHETVVKEITECLLAGTLKYGEEYL